MKSLFQILFLNLKNNNVSSFKLGQDITNKVIENTFSDGLKELTGFVRDGSHLLQEVHPDGRYTYIYINPDSYESLTQVHNWTNEEDH